MAHDIRNGYQIVQKWDNWALLDKGTNESRWIAAHYPHYDKDGNITSWEHGHYYNDLFAAVSWIEENINTAKIIKIDQNVLDVVSSAISYSIYNGFLAYAVLQESIRKGNEELFVGEIEQEIETKISFLESVGYESVDLDKDTFNRLKSFDKETIDQYVEDVRMDNTFLPYKSNSEEPDPDPDI